MPLSKKAKHFLLMGIVFSSLAILFALVYHFNLIKTLDLFVSLVYVVYFVALALLYNGAYLKEKEHKVSKVLNILAGLAFLGATTALLINGFSTGQISLI